MHFERCSLTAAVILSALALVSTVRGQDQNHTASTKLPTKAFQLKIVGTVQAWERRNNSWARKAFPRDKRLQSLADEQANFARENEQQYVVVDPASGWIRVDRVDNNNNLPVSLLMHHDTNSSSHVSRFVSANCVASASSPTCGSNISVDVQNICAASVAQKEAIFPEYTVDLCWLGGFFPDFSDTFGIGGGSASRSYAYPFSTLVSLDDWVDIEVLGKSVVDGYQVGHWSYGYSSSESGISVSWSTWLAGPYRGLPLRINASSCAHGMNEAFSNCIAANATFTPVNVDLQPAELGRLLPGAAAAIKPCQSLAAGGESRSRSRYRK